jgi:hypothetical protein
MKKRYATVSEFPAGNRFYSFYIHAKLLATNYSDARPNETVRAFLVRVSLYYFKFLLHLSHTITAHTKRVEKIVMISLRKDSMLLPFFCGKKSHEMVRLFARSPHD